MLGWAPATRKHTGKLSASLSATVPVARRSRRAGGPSMTGNGDCGVVGRNRFSLQVRLAFQVTSEPELWAGLVTVTRRRPARHSGECGVRFTQ